MNTININREAFVISVQKSNIHHEIKFSELNQSLLCDVLHKAAVMWGKVKIVDGKFELFIESTNALNYYVTGSNGVVLDSVYHALGQNHNEVMWNIADSVQRILHDQV